MLRLSHIDDLRYGNPTTEDIANMKVDGYLDTLLDKLKKYPPYTNSSKETEAEIRELISLQSKSQPENKDAYDKSLIPILQDMYIKSFVLPEDREHILKITNDIVLEVLPIITKLKYHYNRPRPCQLAYYLQMPLYANSSYFVSSPCYPSGHSTMINVVGCVLYNYYPQSMEAMQNFANAAKYSRLFMGVHYPSDNLFADYVAKQIVGHEHFIKKYGL